MQFEDEFRRYLPLYIGMLKEVDALDCSSKVLFLEAKNDSLRLLSDNASGIPEDSGLVKCFHLPLSHLDISCRCKSNCQ